MEMLRLVHSEGTLIRIPHRRSSPSARNKQLRLTELLIYSKSILCASLSAAIAPYPFLRAHGHRGAAASPSQTGGRSSFAVPACGTPGHSTRGWGGRATRVTGTWHAPGFCAAVVALRTPWRVVRFGGLAGEVVERARMGLGLLEEKGKEGGAN